MSFQLPPCPIQEKEFSYSWIKWLLKLRSLIFGSTSVRTGEFRWSAGVDTGEDVIISYASGLILQDSAGVYWRVGVSTLGVITTTNLGTTRP